MNDNFIRFKSKFILNGLINFPILKQRMSAQGIRKCSQSEKELLDASWGQIRPHMQTNGEKYENVLSWCNFYANGKFTVDFPLRDELFQWAQKITKEVTPESKILIAGFIRNPPKSKKSQYWHLDYGKNVNVILVPLVDQGCETATQIIETPIKSKPSVSPLGYESDYGQNVLELLDRQNADFLKVTQIVCRSHSIIKVSSGTVHRGIANNSDNERVLFNIDTCPQDFDFIDEPLVISNISQEEKKE